MDEKLVEYDAKADILYIWYTHPSEVENIITEETGEEVLIDRDRDTGEVIGVTIMHLSKRDAVEGIPVPATA